MTLLHINTKNLNFLPILKALLDECNVSRAAGKLKLTQSAVSHVLQRMRDEFGDDLLVRAGKGMVPTPFARDMQRQLLPLVEALETFYQLQSPFDARTTQAQVAIGTTDYIELVALPSLVSRIRTNAPGITLVSRLLSGHLPKVELETGALDIAIAGYFGVLPEGYYQLKLFTDDFCSAVRSDHPLAKQKDISAAQFAGMDHVLVSPQGDLISNVDKALKALGYTRRIAFATGSFLSPAWMVAESDLVVTGLSRMIRSYAKYFPLHVFPTPVIVPKIQLAMVWHERTHRSPLHKWLRNLIAEASRRQYLV